MQLYFIRHAQSANNALYDATGADVGRVHDPELTPLGQQQAARLAQALRSGHPGASSAEGAPGGGYGITHLYCSLMVRAALTADAVGQALGLAPIGWLDLHEGGGIWLADQASGEPVGLPGNPRSALERRFPRLVLPPEVTEAGWWNRNFEKKEERLPRAQRVIQKLLEVHGGTDDRVALVSHGGFYNYVLSAALGLPRSESFWFVSNNTGISRLDFQDGTVDVMYLNRTDFLPGEVIS
jgi:2,3-bisphosphoglycerate-dependent phosphoglycerate mutase